MTQQDFLGGIFREVGDPFEQRVPRGMVIEAAEIALDAMTQVAIEINPDALRGEAWKVVPADKDHLEIPREVKGISHVSLVRTPGEKEIEVHHIGAESSVAAEIVGPSYAWSYSGNRRIRFLRPDADRDVELKPGLRFMGVLRFVLPVAPDAEVWFPEAGYRFACVRAARELKSAPGATLDVQTLMLDLQASREELVRAMTFFDAASPPPLPEAAGGLF